MIEAKLTFALLIDISCYILSRSCITGIASIQILSFIKQNKVIVLILIALGAIVFTTTNHALGQTIFRFINKYRY